MPCRKKLIFMFNKSHPILHKIKWTQKKTSCVCSMDSVLFLEEQNLSGEGGDTPCLALCKYIVSVAWM